MTDIRYPHAWPTSPLTFDVRCTRCGLIQRDVTVGLRDCPVVLREALDAATTQLADANARYCREGWEERQRLFLSACERLKAQEDDAEFGRIARLVIGWGKLSTEDQRVIAALREAARKWHWVTSPPEATGKRAAEEIERKAALLKAWEDGP